MPQPLFSLIKDPLDVRARLLELGIPSELLDDVRDRWAAEEASATDFEPPMTPGMRGWLGGVGVIREGLADQVPSWEPVNRNNWPLSVSPKGDMAVTCTSGDMWTGLDQPTQPSTKNPKGLVVATAIGRNADQLELLDGKYLRRTDGKPRRVRKLPPLTYLLLIYNTPTECRAELSLPYEIKKRKITWAERILLPVIKRQEPPPADKARRPDDDSGAIDVPVAWK